MRSTHFHGRQTAPFDIIGPDDYFYYNDSAALWDAAAAGTEADARSDAQRALAVVSGRVQTPGLHHAVRVLRDRWGVAHIYAQDSHDLFFAQGLVAAQDRLFQMELWKRAGQGRLSEVLGDGRLGRESADAALYSRQAVEAATTDRLVLEP